MLVPATRQPMASSYFGTEPDPDLLARAAKEACQSATTLREAETAADNLA